MEYVLCTFNNVDLIEKYENILETTPNLVNFYRKSSELIAFDDYIFGIVRVSSNKNIYVSFIKQGKNY